MGDGTGRCHTGNSVRVSETVTNRMVLPTSGDAKRLDWGDFELFQLLAIAHRLL
jgi:hypothetical protein